jgi:glycosyltransferase involved in cell wall biosynthesis
MQIGNPKKLIIIEADMSPSTPSAKSMCQAVPVVLNAGWTVEIWSNVLSLTDSRIIWKKVPRISRIGMIQFWFFSAWITIRYFRERLSGELKESTLIQSVGPYLLWANMPAIHFVSVEYLKQMRAFEGVVRPSWHEVIAHTVASLMERVMWSLKVGRRFWLVVSERLCRDLQRHVSQADQFAVLPNSYNHLRFDPHIRKKAREASREKLGIGEDEIVFAFVCLGGFERKGFPLALKACALLNRRGFACRLLVIGGPDSRPPDLSVLAAKSGVADTSFVISHGRDPAIERLLSAADALLFPSYFEAFSLVEIEAAALGLRLYLTPHYGSEMILKDGINGRLLPWEPEGIAKILEEDMRSGAIHTGCQTAGRAVRDDEFGPFFLTKLDQAYEWIAGANRPHHPNL